MNQLMRMAKPDQVGSTIPSSRMYGPPLARVRPSRGREGSRWFFLSFCLAFLANPAWGELRTWDGKHAIDRIDVTVVYFLPQDRQPLPDWRERLDYFCGRIEAFHAREFQGTSQLKTIRPDEPFVSRERSEVLQALDADGIFFATLREVDRELQFGQQKGDAFPILLVLSDINWHPMDDFYRHRLFRDGRHVFEGNYSGGRHFPGAQSGGARATYLSDRGVGWGLVSADGWRVPYCGSDCVVYHEGVGHPIGLPHPDDGNGSVMSLGQYQGWLSQSWLDEPQKRRLGWKAVEGFDTAPFRTYSALTALPEPVNPRPSEAVALQIKTHDETMLQSCRVRIQTNLWSPWQEVKVIADDLKKGRIELGSFDRPTPVSYRVETTDAAGVSNAVWGYFQVTSEPDRHVSPPPTALGITTAAVEPLGTGQGDSIDLMKGLDVERQSVSGAWKLEGGTLLSPKAYGARIELPVEPPAAYRIVANVEPLDEPNGLILGHVMEGHRFLTLLSYRSGAGAPALAIENLDGKNVSDNATTRHREVFEVGRVSQVVCEVAPGSVRVTVDGETVIDWRGKANQLSLGEYWQTPGERLFVGAYDCRYRISRLSLQPLEVMQH